METKKSLFNRNLLIVVVVLYILTLAVFVYPMLASEPGMTQWWMIPVNTPIIATLPAVASAKRNEITP